MATQVQNAKAVLDALADSIGKTVTAQKATAIVEEFIDDVGGSDDNETKATRFNEMLVSIIRGTGRSHVETKARRDNDAAVQAAVDAANSNL